MLSEGLGLAANACNCPLVYQYSCRNLYRWRYHMPQWIALSVLALLLLVLELGDVVVVNDANLLNLSIRWLPRLM